MGDTESVLVMGRDETAVELEAIRRAGGRPFAVASLSEGLTQLGRRSWSATILPLDLAGADLELAGRIAAQPSAGAVIVVAGELTPELALRAAAAGVKEVFTRGRDEERLESFLRGLFSRAETIPVPPPPAGDAIIGGSRALVDVFKQVGRVAASNATVLVTGESGTGKELVARAIHRASPRAGRPFIAVNCAAIPEDLLESELFGYERGAFTGAVARRIGRFERARGGTLFLDELGDMSLVLQAKILRVIQEREIERLGGEEAIPVDVRIVAATHRDLQALVSTGDFREDLFYRLAVVRMHLPPLRERPEDIRGLALHFAARFAEMHGRPIHEITRTALERLVAHGWPGNVRELSNVMERAVLAAPGEVIAEEHIDLDTRVPNESQVSESLPGYSGTLSLAEVEALHMTRVIREAGGHLGRAAEILGVHRNTVSRKAREYGIEVES